MNPGPDAARTRLTGACSAEGFKRLPRSLELSITVNPAAAVLAKPSERRTPEGRLEYPMMHDD